MLSPITRIFTAPPAHFSSVKSSFIGRRNQAQRPVGTPSPAGIGHAILSDAVIPRPLALESMKESLLPSVNPHTLIPHHSLDRSRSMRKAEVKRSVEAFSSPAPALDSFYLSFSKTACPTPYNKSTPAPGSASGFFPSAPDREIPVPGKDRPCRTASTSNRPAGGTAAH